MENLDNSKSTQVALKAAGAITDLKSGNLTADQVIYALQSAWDEWVGDTNCVPGCFDIRGPQTTMVYADFSREPNFISSVMEHLRLATATSAEVKEEELETFLAYEKAAAHAFRTDLTLMNAKYVESEKALKVALSQLERANRIMKLVSVEFTDEVVTLRDSVEKTEFRDGDYDYFCEVAEEEIPDR